MYVIRWFANLTKFRILKYEYLFSFFLPEKINLLLVQQKTLTNQTLFFSVLNWFWGAESKQKQIFVLQNSKFYQISKSLDDIHTTLNSPISEYFRLCWSITVWLIDFSLLFYRRFYIATTYFWAHPNVLTVSD